MPPSRRGLLGVLGTVAVAALAGCTALDGGGRDPDAPAADANPRDLLPVAPDGWTADDPQQQLAGFIDAEAGYGRGYTSSDGAHYAVECYRFADRAAAVDAASGFEDSGWTAYVVWENVAFAAKGPDVDLVFDLLGHSSALSTSEAREHDVL